MSNIKCQIPNRSRLLLSLMVMVALSLTGCTLAGEPIPAGPIETGPLPGEVATRLAPTANDIEPSQSPTETTPEAPLPTVAASQPMGLVTGSISNGTGETALSIDLEIELRGVTVDEAGNITEFLARTTQIAQDNTYRFEDVPFDVPSSAYIVLAIYDGIEFSNAAIVEPGAPSLDLPLVIYENTADPSVITVDALHLIVRQHPDALLVTEVIVLSNASDRVYASPQPVSGGRRGGVLIPIPNDAYGVTFDDGELGGRYVVSDGLLYDTQQVLPGQESQVITLSYMLPFSGSHLVSLPITYPVSTVNILVDEAIQISSLQLIDGGVQVVNEQVYHKHQAQGLAAGQLLDLQVSPVVRWTDTLRNILAGLIGLLVIVSVFYWLLIARKGSQKRGEKAEQPSISLGAEQQGLIRQIAELDEALEAGKLNHLEWEARRAELKAETTEKMQSKK